ncbi:MAG TPA: trypsin-like peptidase domain-containing protein [Longimicrobiales bacterium]
MRLRRNTVTKIDRSGPHARRRGLRLEAGSWKLDAHRALPVLLALLLAACDEPRPEAEELQDVPEWAQSPIRENALGDVPLRLDTLTASRLSGAFRAAADRALPSLVYIGVESADNPTEPMFRFFGAQPPSESGSGSGFIFDNDGYILTNNHVVEGASAVTVRLVDGREYPARLIGADPNSDVAVIKIEPREGETLPVAQMGSSDELRVGDWVLALGSPFSLDFSVTAGIVSAKGRTRVLDDDNSMALESFIQTDAAINPGNSGGPLVDLLGRVVGINTAIYSPSGVYAGYGFAIPISIAYRVAQDLVEFGVVHRPQLGVSVGDVTADDAEYYELPRVAGAVIRTITEGSPAARSGLEVGDVILGVDSSAVSDATQLITTLAQRNPGDTISVVFMRGGRPLRVAVELSEFQTGERVAPPTTERVVSRGSSQPDFTVIPFDARYARSVGYGRDSGVIIRSVEPGSMAEARGLEAGMILFSLNEQPIRSVTDLERALARIGRGKVLSLRVYHPAEGFRTETVINYRPR